MQRISITNPQNIIDGTAKKYYFKLRNTGGPKGDKGDKGDTGATGPQGPQGNAATVSVGSTTTLPVGYDATVTNTGSIYNAVLNFGIPQGPRGPQGVKGDPGEPGQKGDPGQRGEKGERGTNATVYVGTTSTLNPGSQATVYNSGTDSNAVLNFGIPKGEKGDTGATGPAGQDGQNFTPTIVAELPATGDESKLYLTPKAHTTSTATGNPITATVAEEAGNMESFQLDGDTFQQSYTGKNLLNPIAISGTDKGITYSFDPATNEITLDGTATAKSVCYFSNENRISLDGEYTLSYEKVSGSITPSGTCRLEIAASSWGSNTIYLDLQDSSASTTATKTFDVFAVDFNIGQGTVCNNFKIKLQLEKSASATSFEPYVGGQPSPNPDYPQPIQTVTGEQTVTVEGKNLFNATGTTIYGGYFKAAGSISGYQYPISTQKDRWFYIPCLPNTTYTITKPAVDPIANNRFRVGTSAEVPVNGTELSDFYNAGDGTSTATYTFTTSATANYLCVYYGSLTTADPTDVLQTVLNGIQIEIGATATTYAPYSKQTLPISLGSIELCKLGTYQDYIWKDGEDWKVHKATKTIYLKDITWLAAPTSVSEKYRMRTSTAPDDILEPADNNTKAVIKSSVYDVITAGDTYAARATGISVQATTPHIFIYDPNYNTLTSPTSFTQKMASTNATAYYALATATDTVITDTDLIAQLEAIRTASLENGTNTITNSTPAPNLAGDMEIGYYGYNPTNRYDKFIWLDINDNYEQIGE